MQKPIIVTEYPKSGGNWVTSLIGDALRVPKRDIYMGPGFNQFDATNHPWYTGGQPFDFPTQSVIKSHEPPRSPAITFDAKYLHLVRDGRDVIVSRWFFDKDFLVKNGIVSSFNTDFDTYVEEKSLEWATYVASWLDTGVVTVRYEDFVASPATKLAVTIKQIANVDVSEDVCGSVVAAHTKEKFAASLAKTFKHNTFVRSGVPGDWRNHFAPRHEEIFAKVAEPAMRRLGYAL